MLLLYNLSHNLSRGLEKFLEKKLVSDSHIFEVKENRTLIIELSFSDFYSEIHDSRGVLFIIFSVIIQI